MNNEIGRKITSLTLMTIMVAGGMTFAVPGVMPAAHAANANLFVSAENSQFNNYFGGPMVIEVVVNDPDIKDTDEAKGEPDVTINGDELRMAQGTDGLWYAYFADVDQAALADGASLTASHGLDFGFFCASDETATSAATPAEAIFSDTEGYYVSATDCAGAGDAPSNVVREAKDLSSPAGDVGQIQLINEEAWPIIQTFEFNPTGNVVVQYNKGGNPQTVTLTFDTLDGTLDAALDRDSYPQGAAVHATLTDQAMNIDPTDEDSWTFDTVNGLVFYQAFDESGNNAGICGERLTGANDDCDTTDIDDSVTVEVSGLLSDFFFEDGGLLFVDVDAQGTGTAVIEFVDNDDQIIIEAFDADDSGALDGDEIIQPVTLTELGPNSGVFANYDELDAANMVITSDALRGTSATLDWDDTGYTIVVGFDFASIDIVPTDDTWNSGEAIEVILMDQDANQNSRFDEDLDLNDPSVAIIPSIQIGNPLTLSDVDLGGVMIDGPVGIDVSDETVDGDAASEVQSFSDRAILRLDAATTFEADADDDTILIPTTHTDSDLAAFAAADSEFSGFVVINYDIRSIVDAASANVFTISLDGGAGAVAIATDISEAQGEILFDLNNLPDEFGVANDDAILEAFGDDGDPLIFSITLQDDTGAGAAVTLTEIPDNTELPIVIDIFSFGFTDDGADPAERVDNMIVRLELEENGDNTGEFVGELEYIMLNQLNILDENTYTGIGTIADDPILIVSQDFTDEDSLRVNYNDLGADGVVTPVADQEEAPTHSGTVSFDSDSYKIADTVTITLEDQDLNVDSDLREIYTTVDPNAFPGDAAQETIGAPGLANDGLGILLNVTFDDELWAANDVEIDGIDCAAAPVEPFNDGLTSTGMTMVETTIDSGIFIGDFQIPDFYCSRSNGGEQASTTGTDIEVNYIDYRDASGEIIEVGDGAGVRANTGSVSLDRTVYPVPFGVPENFADNNSSSPDGRSLFPVHVTGVDGAIDDDAEFLPNGDLTIHVRINDPDFDISASGSDSINRNVAGEDFGPVKVSVIRGSESVTIGYAGGPDPRDGFIDVDDSNPDDTRQFGPISETAPDSGIFEADIVLRYTDGPADDRCPSTELYTDLVVGVDGTADPGEQVDRFAIADTDDYCILQGDILQVEYTDPEDASGDENTVTDSATFDLRNGVLQTDKSVYIIGGDMIMTLIEPDFDLENDEAETYNLDLIEWDSDAATITMGNQGGEAAAFDPEPTDFRETGDSTGIFQIVIEIPEELDGDRLERGEEIVLEYTDWGPSGSDYVGEEDEDVNVTVYTSNFGATVELDQKVYTWTDKVFITIVAPDHNFDGDLVDEIGNSDTDPIKISTRGHDLDNYKLVETGTDTGIFTGEVILVGFEHNADGDASTGADGTGFDKGNQATSPNGSGPTNGFLETDDDDGITVSFEFSEDETVVGSALIRWNIGEVQWLEASYPASGTGVVRVIDPDMNLDPEAVDNFDVDVWSDSDAGGIDLTVTETNEATGIFEGTVFFTTFDESSGHRLRVAEGDTVTAEYEDNTLPDPYTTADELDITATSLIGTVVPPLERAPAANLRTVDAFGNSLDTVSAEQQVQISADLANGQDREQSFAYLVQIQDGNGVTVSLAWITGSLASGQSFSPALSWIPTEAGTYTATAFVWESVDNPTALSPPVSTTVTVN